MTNQDKTGPVERPIILYPHETRFINRKADGWWICLLRLVKPPADGYYKLHPAEFHTDFRSVAAAKDSGWIFWTMPAPSTVEKQVELNEFTRRAYAEGNPCPYATPGDRLWGRETWAAISPDEFDRPIAACTIEYRADGEWSRFPGQWPPEYAHDPERPRWRSPLVMPRWASRIGLEVVDAFPRRLQAMADTTAQQAGFLSLDAFRAHWDVTHKQFPWSLNPWAWFIPCRCIPLPPVARPAVEED